MSCNNNNFVISKGSDNTFTFIIKKDNSTLPLEIEQSDTFFADLIELGTDEKYQSVSSKPLVKEDNLNGKVSLSIPKEDTLGLVSEKGAKVDRYYLKPTYKLVLTCSTVNNGEFTVKVPEVYID